MADGRIWANSALKGRLSEFLTGLPLIPVATKASDTGDVQQESIPPYILADSAYPSTVHMVPTFKNTDCSNDRLIKNLNFKLASIRYCIENAFGICKGRFRLLNRPLECAKEDMRRAIILVTAIFTLHNFMISINDDTPIDAISNATDSDDDDEDEVENNRYKLNENFATRDVLLRHLRWLEE